MGNVSYKIRKENKHTHFTFGNFFLENRAFDEIMSTNTVKSEGPQMAIWRRVACWISKATRAHTQNM